MSHKKTHLLNSFAVVLTHCKLSRRVVRIPKHGSEVWQVIIVKCCLLKGFRSGDHFHTPAHSCCSLQSLHPSFSLCLSLGSHCHHPSPQPFLSWLLHDPHLLPQKAQFLAAIALFILLAASQPSPSCVCHLHLSYMVFRVEVTRGSGFVLSLLCTGETTFVTHHIYCPKARQRFQDLTQDFPFLLRTAVWAMAECGILRGQCSLDSGGSGFFTSSDLQDERGNLQQAAQSNAVASGVWGRIWPTLGHVGIANKQSLTSRHTHMRVCMAA